MSKLADAFRLSQRVSPVAKEEASRLGHPQIDVDHLFLALLTTHGPAGEVLRSFGITLAEAREATQTVHTQLLAGVSVTHPALAPRPLQDPLLSDIDYSPRALKLFRDLDDHSSDLPMLTALLDEPSRFALQVLEQLGLQEEELRTAISRRKETEKPEPELSTPRDPHWHSETHTGFIPVPPDAVWALVADPGRRREWDSLVASATPLDEQTWQLTTTTSRPASNRPRVAPTLLHSHQRLITLEPQTLIEWETTWPDRGRRSNRQRLRVHFLPVTGGTQIALTLALQRRKNWRRLLQPILDPGQSLMMRQLLLDQAAGISQVLR